MPTFQEIKNFFDTTVNISSCPNDASNNGIQVEASTEIKRIAFGVDGCYELFAQAAEWNADMILVHHGISWGPGFKRIDGVLAKQLQILFKNDISLYAVHLPLDGHPKVGHNALIAKSLNLQNCYRFAEYCGLEIGVLGTLENDNSFTAETLAQKVGTLLNSNHVEVLGDKNKEITTVAVISGSGGSDGITEAAKMNADCLITGEVGHSCFHLIKELGISVIAAGHYKSEVPGVKAMQKEVKIKFGENVECKFFDIPTGL